MSSWAELVLHVLAHVSSHVPSSLWDPVWVGFVAEHAGEGRTLQEDAASLEAMAMTHDELAEVQLLAWLFDSVERTVPVADRPLAELSASEVDAPAILRVLQQSRSLANIEVLRAAAELEAEVYAGLPPPRSDAEARSAALARVTAAAPWLSCCSVEHLRPLRLRGRVLQRRIWVGLPCRELGPSSEHVAWQAAHEATVTEISEHASAHGLRPAYLPVEQCALHLLTIRAERCGLAEEHRRWLAHFGRLPSFDREAIEPRFLALVDQALAR